MGKVKGGTMYRLQEWWHQDIVIRFWSFFAYHIGGITTLAKSMEDYCYDKVDKMEYLGNDY